MDDYLTKKRKSTPDRDANATTASPRKKPKRTTSGIAEPSGNIFDPWNSSSTGHQRADNRLSGSTSWRDSRNLKLGAQFRGGLAGGDRVADTVGAGSENFGKDGKKTNGGWVNGASALREKGQKSLWEVVGSGGKVTRAKERPGEDEVAESALANESEMEATGGDEAYGDSDSLPPSHQPSNQRSDDNCAQGSLSKKQMFRNLCIFINGSTAPLVSDHRLKYLLTEHGASMNTALARRSVTHVIVGKTYSNGGTGGGLAGTKIQKEISKIRGRGIKYVSVEWVLESIKAGKRLSEARFEAVKFGGHGQKSVYSAFKTKKPNSASPPESQKR